MHHSEQVEQLARNVAGLHGNCTCSHASKWPATAWADDPHEHLPLTPLAHLRSEARA